MNGEIVFRALFILTTIAMLAIRVYFQSKVLRDQRKVEVKEEPVSLVAASVAALTTIVFGLEYMIRPGTFAFAYLWAYPAWLRWLGGALLVGGVTLLGLAHHHLGQSFHSLVVSKEDQALVETGPYRWIRHPVYTAYLASYLGGGLLASNWVLTFVPVTLYAVLVAIRLRREEAVLEETFGERYVAYKARTGRLLPRIKVE